MGEIKMHQKMRVTIIYADRDCANHYFNHYIKDGYSLSAQARPSGPPISIWVITSSVLRSMTAT
jgi:hypothetical protein